MNLVKKAGQNIWKGIKNIGNGVGWFFHNVFARIALGKAAWSEATRITMETEAQKELKEEQTKINQEKEDEQEKTNQEIDKEEEIVELETEKNSVPFLAVQLSETKDLLNQKNHELVELYNKYKLEAPGIILTQNRKDVLRDLPKEEINSHYEKAIEKINEAPIKEKGKEEIKQKLLQSQIMLSKKRDLLEKVTPYESTEMNTLEKQITLKPSNELEIPNMELDKQENNLQKLNTEIEQLSEGLKENPDDFKIIDLKPKKENETLEEKKERLGIHVEYIQESKEPIVTSEDELNMMLKEYKPSLSEMKAGIILATTRAECTLNEIPMPNAICREPITLCKDFIPQKAMLDISQINKEKFMVGYEKKNIEVTKEGIIAGKYNDELKELGAFIWDKLSPEVEQDENARVSAGNLQAECNFAVSSGDTGKIAEKTSDIIIAAGNNVDLDDALTIETEIEEESEKQSLNDIIDNLNYDTPEEPAGEINISDIAI